MDDQANKQEDVETWMRLPVSNKQHLMKCNPNRWEPVAREAVRQAQANREPTTTRTKRIV